MRWSFVIACMGLKILLGCSHRHRHALYTVSLQRTASKQLVLPTTCILTLMACSCGCAMLII